MKPRKKPRNRPLVGVTIPLIALALAFLLSGGAQTSAQETEEHAVRLLLGTCAAPGGMAFELTPFEADTTLDGTPVPVPDVTGAESALPIEVSTTTIEASLSDLVDEPHALAIFDGDEASDRLIACGDVGGPLSRQMAGMVMPGDELIVGLAERGDSAHAGIALLRADGADAVVTIYLVIDSSPGTPSP